MMHRFVTWSSLSTLSRMNPADVADAVPVHQLNVCRLSHGQLRFRGIGSASEFGALKTAKTLMEIGKGSSKAFKTFWQMGHCGAFSQKFARQKHSKKSDKRHVNGISLCFAPALEVSRTFVSSSWPLVLDGRIVGSLAQVPQVRWNASLRAFCHTKYNIASA